MSPRNASQIQDLEKLWYTYGNQGPKHSIGNHKWIQKLIFEPDSNPEQALSYYQEKFPNDGGNSHTKMITQECIQAVNQVLKS